MTGFRGSPLTSRFSCVTIGPRSSIGCPIPLNVRPSISGESAISIGCPVSLVCVFFKDMLSDPSKTWITALSSYNSIIRPILRSEPLTTNSTISSKKAPCTPSRAIRGPLMLLSPKYSIDMSKSLLMRSFPAHAGKMRQCHGDTGQTIPAGHSGHHI